VYECDQVEPLICVPFFPISLDSREWAPDIPTLDSCGDASAFTQEMREPWFTRADVKHITSATVADKIA
jgi:hypothetical protein